MKQSYLLFSFSIFFFFIGLSESSGQYRVLSKEDGTAIPFVSIHNTSFSQSVVSDDQGDFDISVFESGDTLVFNHISFDLKRYAVADLPNDIFLDPKKHYMDQVVVSYSKWAHEKDAIQSGVASLSRKEIEVSNAQTAADLLGSTREIFVQKSQQGGGSPMIRGFAANRLLYVVDGVRMNNAIFRGGNLHNVISIDPLSLSKVEVLLGSYSVVYGSDAIGGVMNFTTHTPSFSLEKTSVNLGTVLRASSANEEKTAHANLRVAGENWSYVGTFSRSDFGHLRMGSHGEEDFLRPFYVERVGARDTVLQNSDDKRQIPTAYEQWSTLQKLRWRTGSKWVHGYTFYHAESTNFGRFDRHSRERNGLPRYGRWDYGPMSWSLHHLNSEYEFDHWLFERIKIGLAYQKFKESRITRNYQAIEELNRRESVDAYSLNIDAIKELNQVSNFYYGFESVFNEVESTGESLNIRDFSRARAASRYPSAQWQSWGAYLMLHNNWNNKHLLNLGLRYNYSAIDADLDQEFYPIDISEIQQHNHSVTANASYRKNLNEYQSLSVAFSTGFRAPNVDDIAKIFDSEPGAVLVPNPDLDPEYSYNLELSWRRNKKRWNIESSIFYTLLNEAMVRRDFTFNGQDSILFDGVLSKVQAIQNANEAFVYGAQLFSEYALAENLILGGQLNYQKGEELDFNGTRSPMRHAAPLFGTAWLKYTFKDFDFTLNWNFQDEVSFDELALSEQSKVEIYASDENGNPYAPSWHRLDFNTNWKINKNYNLQFGVENIFDQRYRTYSSGIASAGRNFFISVRGNWSN